jgi:hypothetical protein
MATLDRVTCVLGELVFRDGVVLGEDDAVEEVEVVALDGQDVTDATCLARCVGANIEVFDDDVLTVSDRCGSISEIWSRLEPRKWSVPPRNTGQGPKDRTEMSLPYWSVSRLSSLLHPVSDSPVRAITSKKSICLMFFIVERF